MNLLKLIYWLFLRGLCPRLFILLMYYLLRPSPIARSIFFNVLNDAFELYRDHDQDVI